MVYGIVLASGFSKRMGKNKLLEKIHGKYLIEYVLETALASNLEGVWVVYQDLRVFQILKKYPVTAVYNEAPEKGQSEALKRGITSIKGRGAYLFFVGDQPMISIDTVNRLIETFESTGKDIVIPRYRGKNGNPVLFSSRLRSDLMVLDGDEGGRQIIRSGQWKTAYIDIDDSNESMDIDCPRDLERIQGIMKEKNGSLNSGVKRYKMDRDE